MTTEEIKEQLTPIFRQTFSDQNLVLTDEMSANDVEKWDSLTHMQLVSNVEAHFGIKFKLKDLNKLKKVGDLVAIVESKIG